MRELLVHTPAWFARLDHAVLRGLHTLGPSSSAGLVANGYGDPEHVGGALQRLRLRGLVEHDGEWPRMWWAT